MSCGAGVSLPPFPAFRAHRALSVLRLNRTTELLLDGGLMEKEEAEQLDFADAFHFSRTFKRVYGLAPEQFLKRNRVWLEG